MKGLYPKNQHLMPKFHVDTSCSPPKPKPFILMATMGRDTNKHAHNKNDYIRSLIHDHRILIDRVKLLEAENSKLYQELTHSRETEQYLRERLDMCARN